MPKYRSATTTHGYRVIWRGARALWRATGMTDSDFGKPIIAGELIHSVCAGSRSSARFR